MPSEKLSNVVGAPFAGFVLDQLNIRANRATVGTGPNGKRSRQEVLYLANKMSWVKLTSSIRIFPTTYQNLTAFNEAYNLNINEYSQPDSLAKNWILQAGTSFSNGNNITLRSGFGEEGAYGMGGTESTGYRPMPGLTNVTIESKGILGSLREANLEFKVWNIEQLNVVEALYFRLGYSMILEWGHVQYFDNTSPQNIDGNFTISDGGIDPFIDTRKEIIQQIIAKKRQASSGNYDGMLGIVSNFTWSYNQEGGYDCTLKIIGLGSIIDTLRINLSYKMPDILFRDFQSNEKSIEQKIKEEQERKERQRQRELEAQQLQQQQQIAEQAVTGLPPLPTNKPTIYPIYEYDIKQANPPKPLLNRNEFLEQNQYYSHTTANIDPSTLKVGNSTIQNVLNLALSRIFSTDNLNSYTTNVFYRASGTDRFRLNNKRTGLFLTSPFNWIPADLAVNYPQPVKVDAKAISKRADYILQEFGRGKFANFNIPVSILDYYDQVFAISNNLAITNYIQETDKPFQDAKPRLKGLVGFNSSFNYGLDTRYDLDKRELAEGQILLNEEIAIDYFTTTRTKGSRYIGTGKQVSIVYEYQQKVKIQKLTGVSEEFRVFYFGFKYIPQPDERYLNIEIAKFINDWFQSSNPVWNITTVESTNYFNDRSTIAFGTKFFSDAPIGTNTYKDLVINGNLDLSSLVPAGTPAPVIQLTTNDPFFITEILPRPDPVTATPMEGNPLPSTQTVVVVNNADGEQKDEAQKFASALHAMLNYVKSEVQFQSQNYPKVSGNKISIKEATQKFFVDGVLNGIFDSSSTISQSELPFDLIPYARKGFNSSLMSDPKKFGSITDVNLDQLCYAYYIKYRIKDSANPFNFPVYIKLGYLLFFLNSMCLIYDSKQDTDKHPYVYLDFHPEYNFCLTNPYHLSVDPLTCMIPYQGSAKEYKMLFPQAIRDTVFPDEEDESKEKGLTPKKNGVSKFLDSFKNTNNNYQGKTMEILLSVDFLLDTLKSYTSNDPSHSIYLKGFLDAIVVGINKSCGNINMFRVSYDDDSNTVIIKDDQFVPCKPDEPSLLNRENYKNGNTLGRAKYGMIPIFGLNSMVREFEFKTNINTSISKQIAISAQADPQPANQTDHSSYSFLNQDYVDAYKPKVSDSSRLNSTSNSAVQFLTSRPGVTVSQRPGIPGIALPLDNSTNGSSYSVDKDQAEKFNSHILAIYSGGDYLNPGRIDFAINYYISSMADRKAFDPVTYAAPFIPANLSMTIDGISGIVMGNAFTVPEDRLPLSLRGDGNITKVGFIVSGLTHTLDNNQWLTKIKGQMIRLPDVTQYSKPTVQEGTLTITPDEPDSSVLPVGACKPKYDPVKNEYVSVYSGAEQVPITESINSRSVYRYYPNLLFVKGKSDIAVRNDVPLLTESEILDDTTKNRFDLGLISSPAKYFVVHHTGGKGSADDVYATFYCRGLPAQYVIDRQGRIHRFMPDGTKGWHAGDGYNNNSIGVEIIALNDADVLDVQVKAAVRLIRFLGFSKNQVVGHGEIAGGRKQSSEGKRVLDYLKNL